MSDAGDSAHSGYGQESDPEVVCFHLAGLPAFPSPSEAPASTTSEPAFLVASGPPTLIREVFLSPSQEPLAPPVIYELLQQASADHNAGRHDSALKCVEEARRVCKLHQIAVAVVRFLLTASLQGRRGGTGTRSASWARSTATCLSAKSAARTLASAPWPLLSPLHLVLLLLQRA